MAVNTSIWKDTNYAVSSANSPYEYSIDLKTGRQITVNGTTQDEVITVFNGKAYVRPGDDYIQININHIAQDYLDTDLIDLRGISSNTSYISANAYRQFYLKNSSGSTVQTFNFLNDWSYEDLNLNGDVTLSEPINGHGCNGMFFLTTKFVNSSQRVVTDVNINAGSGYDTTHCGDFAIYYLSRKGGWCSFLFEGNATQTDTYNKYNISVPYNNQSIEFQKKTYHNEITTTYKLYTGWLSDDEARNLSLNLLGTNKAYLHNLRTDEIVPVLVTDGTATYKTYRNQGKRRVNYEINVEYSQTKHNI